MNDYPSDYGLPPLNHPGGSFSTTSPMPRVYSSLQPNLFPMYPTMSPNGSRAVNGGGMLLPADQQYPTLPHSFRSPYIHTADSGPSAIVYYPKLNNNSPTTGGTYTGTPQQQPIYEDLYSQVKKSGSKKVNNCDTDSAALERLSQLLTTNTTSASEISQDLIALHPEALHQEAPIASQEVSSLGGITSSSIEDQITEKSNVFQELDDAFQTLDQELVTYPVQKSDDVIEVDSADLQTLQLTTADKQNDNKQLTGRIVSAPTAI